MAYRVFITGASLAQEARDILDSEGCISAYGNPLDTPEEIADKLAGFNPDALIVRQGKIKQAVLEAAPNLKAICKHGVGVDNIDIESATVRGIPVMITPGANFESVAEHALTMTMALLKRVPLQDRMLRNGIFNKVNYDGEDILNKTIGLVGFGRIGRRYSELLACLGTKILVYDPFLKESKIPHHIERAEKPERIFREADIISLHCSLTKETRGMINRDSISLMKPSVYIVNLSRGEIIIEADLVEALELNRVAGAALDTFEKEPPDADNPLFKLDNVIFTSHIGGASRDSLINMATGAVANVLAVLKGNTIDPDCILNPETISETDNSQ